MNDTALALRVPRILLDGHGGDQGPGMVVSALAISLKRKDKNVKYGIVGRSEVLEPLLKQHGIDGQVELISAEDVIEMCESPSTAVRKKKNSSIHVGARAVRDGDWDALVSAGNTGALMAISKLILKTLPGIDRPAIATVLPGRTLFLDVGANVDNTARHLVQFGVMGSCYMQAEGIELPRVGLLNIGSEDIKGNDVVRLAATELYGIDVNFIGNVEGTELFGDKADVVVCDGFVGNVALKTIEGTAKFAAHHLKRELTSSLLAKVGAVLSGGALRRLRNAINPNEYNGAPLLGLNGVVVKSHGSADDYAFACAIEVACRQVSAGLLNNITDSISRWMEAE